MGAVPPAGVVAVKSWLQPAADEAAVVQVFSRLARELILAAGDEPVCREGSSGRCAGVRLARFATVATALPRPCVLVAVAPILPPALRNWASPQAVAAVVTSLMTICEEATSWLHAPSVAKAMAALSAEPPILPPRTTR